MEKYRLIKVERRGDVFCVRLRHSRLELSARKRQCLDCGRQFRQRLPGILPGQHASEPFREAVFRQHPDGINRSRVGSRGAILATGLSSAGKERVEGCGFPPV